MLSVWKPVIFIVMPIDFDAVCNSEKARDWLYEIWYVDALQEEAKNVLTLAWSGGMCSGQHRIVEWNDMYFFLGDEDCGEEGPFKSLEDVLPLVERYWIGSFTVTSLRPELHSKILPLKRLLKIARDLVRSEGEEIDINDKRFVLAGGELVERSPKKN
jgi:hypothetical protein